MDEDRSETELLLAKKQYPDAGGNGRAPTPEPEVVHVDATHVRMSPRAIRKLKAATGRSLQQLMESDEDADQIQALTFIDLERRHRDVDPGELWEMAADAEADMSPDAPDPFVTGSSTAAPRSPTTGGSVTPTPSTS